MIVQIKSIISTCMFIMEQTVSFMVVSTTLIVHLIEDVNAWSDFSKPISCYQCYDKAENTTCSHPPTVEFGEASPLPTVQCQRGACVKWAFYKQHKLMIQRTCSEKIDIRILLAEACMYEKRGNGYLCMCAGDNCNTASHLSIQDTVKYIILAPILSMLFSYF